MHTHKDFLSEIPTRGNWILPFVLLALGWLASGVVSYLHEDKSVTARVTAIETKQGDNYKRLDHIQSQVDRLVEWALGKQ